MQMLSAVGSQIGQYLERLRAEEKVRESEALKGAILESAPDCIVTLDREGRILDFNSSAESIIFYTDGVIEARSDGETFGAERLREIVAGCVGKTASKIAKEIEKAVLGFAGGPIGDDVALMVLRIPTK